MTSGRGKVFGFVKKEYDTDPEYLWEGDFDTAVFRHKDTIAIRLKIQTKSSHKTHKSQLLRLDFVNLKSWIAIRNGSG